MEDTYGLIGGNIFHGELVGRPAVPQPPRGRATPTSARRSRASTRPTRPPTEAAACAASLVGRPHEPCWPTAVRRAGGGRGGRWRDAPAARSCRRRGAAGGAAALRPEPHAAPRRLRRRGGAGVGAPVVLRRRLGVRRPGRRAGRAGRPAGREDRQHRRAGGPRGRRRAAGLRQHLPPPRPRAAGLRSVGEPRRHPVPLPRVELRARRPPAPRASLRRRRELRPLRVPALAGAVRGVGRLDLRERVGRRAGLLGGAGHAGRRGRALRVRAAGAGRDAHLHPRGQLEAAPRELPGVLPLPADPSRAVPGQPAAVG